MLTVRRLCLACGPTRRTCVSAAADAFRGEVKIDGVTLVTDASAARRALQVLHRVRDRVHAWDTETADVLVGRVSASPVNNGRVLCATCFCGDDVDFGNGPRLFVDNDGPAAGILREHFGVYFADTSFRKVFHNYSFDKHMLRRHDIIVGGFHADTLHLARLFDTSLASWEGKAARAGAQRTSAKIPPIHMSPSVATPSKGSKSHANRSVAAKKIVAVRLGGMTLSSGCEHAMLHTATEVAPPTAPMPDGYGLKALAKFFGVSGSDHESLSFSIRYGSHQSAAEKAHNSREGFRDWVEYSTTDAVLTHRLFKRLRAELEARPWFSPVHERPIAEVLRDQSIASELLKGGSCAAQHNTTETMWSFYETYVREFGEFLTDMERIGIGVDPESLARVRAEATRDEERCQRSFVHCMETVRSPDGGEILNPEAGLMNIRSSLQLRTLLYGGRSVNAQTKDGLEKERQFPAPKDKRANGSKHFVLRGLGLAHPSKRKYLTGCGWPSVSVDALDEVTRNAEQQLLSLGYSEDDSKRVAAALLQLREANKAKSILSSFVEPLEQHSAATGRIHPSWALDTSTGRLACRRPNLQNLPAGDKYRVRDAFRSAPGKVFVVADYSQLEMRVLAHMANSRIMIEKLSKGGDYHSEVAAEMFPHIAAAIANGEAKISETGLDASGQPSVKKKFSTERAQAKAVNFSIVFGKEPSSLADDLSISKSQAETLIAAWHRSKPEVATWTEQVKFDSRLHGRMLSLLGRWRTLPFVNERLMPAQRRRSERAAVNFAIQGSAADIVMAATLRLARSVHLGKLGFQVVLQVHDELVIEGPEEYAEEARKVMRELMMNPFQEHSPNFAFRLPLPVDVGIGTSLYNAKA